MKAPIDALGAPTSYCICLKTGLCPRKIVHHVCNITPILKSKGKKTICLSQFVLSSEIWNETICRVIKYNSETIYDSFSEFRYFSC